jgi:hypothetical protein
MMMMDDNLVADPIEFRKAQEEKRHGCDQVPAASKVLVAAGRVGG